MQDWVNGLPNAKWINSYAMPGFNKETMDTMAKLSGQPNPQQTGLKPAWAAPQGQPTNPAASQTTPPTANATQTPTQNVAPKIDPNRLKTLGIDSATIHVDPNTKQAIGWSPTQKAYVDIATGKPFVIATGKPQGTK